MATNGQTGLVKSMNGIVYFDDGNGFTTDGSGDISCNTLTASILNVATFTITTLSATLAYITNLYVNNIRSNSVAPTLFNDNTYTSVQLANTCDCDIALGGGQTASRLTLGGNTGRTGDIDIGNGAGNSCNVNLSTNILNTGQVGIKRFIFSLNNITSAVVGNAINLFTTTTNTITLGKWKFLNQIIDPVNPASISSIGAGITTGGLLIGNNSMNSDINILVGAGRSVNIPNLVIGSLTGVSGNFDVAGILTAGITNPLLTHRISKVNIGNQTVYATDPTQPIQFGTSQTTGNVNIGSGTNTNQIGNTTITNTSISSTTGSLTANPTTLNLNPTNLQLFTNPFRYVPWTVYNNIANSGTVFVKGTISNPLFNYISSALTASYSIIGNTMYINYYFYQGSNAGTVLGSGAYLFPFPSGYMIDSTKVVMWPNSGGNSPYCSSLGTSFMYYYGNNNGMGGVFPYISGGVSYLLIMTETFLFRTVGVGGTQYAYESTLAGLSYKFTASIPIV